ncbi:hypothetical protein AB0M46_14930 [Dactylosporangium sp. NPDC051485]|uniref:hypothetical protein n=1 Tax=Dactylosporangium sp. NPDC051485 TaxID=3154846 RepID=UPI00343EC4E6
MSELLDDVVAAAGLTVFGAAPVGDRTLLPASPALPGPDLSDRIEALRSRGLDRVALLATGAPAAASRAIATTLGLSLLSPQQALSPESLARTALVLAGEPDPEIDAYLRMFGAFLGDELTRHLVVVAAPGSPWAALGAETFLTSAPPHSALSPYSLVAPGLAGADIAALLDQARSLLAPSLAPGRPHPIGFGPVGPVPTPRRSEAPDLSPGLALGVAVGEAARNGRNKLAVAPDGSGIDGLGEWLEWLFAAVAPHVVPVVLENPSSWGHEGPDVLSVTVGGVLGRNQVRSLAPDLSVNGPLGAQLLAWEQAALVAGALGPGPALVEGAIEVYGETRATTVIGAVDELMRRVPEGGYVAVAAHLDREADAAAAGVRDALAGRVARAVTFGWGPRPPLPGLGALIQITAAGDDVPVPGRPYTFDRLLAAQAAAEGRGPRLRLHLTDRATGIDQLLAALGG